MAESAYPDAVRPPYYGTDDAGIQAIDIIENMNFCRGNAIKYLWRAGSKDNELDDLYKAKWYVEREIARVERLAGIVRNDGTAVTLADAE
ncbi:MAG TPA: DUF3310 domain-containing protein [Galbitalea sp.]|jgi:hypothetical protein